MDNDNGVRNRPNAKRRNVKNEGKKQGKMPIFNEISDYENIFS